MTPELEGAEEERVGRPTLGTSVVHSMCVRDTANPRKAREPTDGKSTMHDPVVHQEIREAERGGAETDAEGHFAGRADRTAATVQDERDRERRVEERQSVVQFERALPRTMMRAMDGKENAMPEAAMEKARPEIHQHGDHEGGRPPDDDARDVHDPLRGRS